MLNLVEKFTAEAVAETERWRRRHRVRLVAARSSPPGCLWTVVRDRAVDDQAGKLNVCHLRHLVRGRGRATCPAPTRTIP